MNDERSLEDKLFTSELYQMAQREFLSQGLEGAVNKFLEELSDYIRFCKGYDKDDYPEGKAVAIILKEAIARRMLQDLKDGLLNNDVNQLDVEKLISGKKDEN
jgi:hypothetical protein